MTPGSFTGPVGGVGHPFSGVYQSADCNGYLFGPYAMPSPSYSSTNSSVASVNGSTGQVSCLAGGTATINASMSYSDYYWTGPYDGNECVAEPFQPQTSPGGGMTVVGPDHVKVVLDQAGFPAACPSTGVYVRQMVMQVVDSLDVAQTNNPSIKETYNPLHPVNSCGTGSPVAPSCAATGPGGPFPCPSCGPGQFLDTMAVTQNLCGSGVSQSSGCGFSHTSTWPACSTSGTNTLWTSPRVTHSNGITVNGNSTTFSPGTDIH